MRVVLAPDKFKGTLTAAEVAGHLVCGLRAARPDDDFVVVPVADGGDGTLDAAVAAGFERVVLQATGPTRMPLTTSYARRGRDAVVELADVSGLSRLPQAEGAPLSGNALSIGEGSRSKERFPTRSGRSHGGAVDFAALTATSRGTGEVLAAALDAGCRRIVVGIGGSASTDGGAGLLRALGVEVRDAAGVPIDDGGAALARAASVDVSRLHPGLALATVVVACDVDNPLTGPNGAAAVYGPQKGATPADVETLDAALSHWADLVAQTVGVDHRDAPGAGAAGGVGFGLLALAGAGARPGAELVFELVGLEQTLMGADLVITGEGSLDEQTLHGKAPAAVAALARRARLPVVAVAGRCSLNAEALVAAWISRVYTLADEATRPDESFTAPGPLLARIGRRIADEILSPSGPAQPVPTSSVAPR